MLNRISSIVLVLLINCLNISYAASEYPELKDEVFPEIDFQDIDAIRAKNQKSIYQIVHSPTARNLNYAEKEALKIQLKDIIKSGTYLAAIKRGSQLIHVRTGKIYYNKKDIVVRAYRQKDYEGYQLLLNKNGYISYKSLASLVINIKEVTSMYEEPLKYTPVTATVKYDIEDEKLNLTSQFLVHMGLTRPVFMRDLINSESHIGQTIRYESTTYGRWDFPFKLGATLQYENHFGTFANGKYNMNSISAGPAFKTEPFKMFGNTYFAILQARLALYSKISVATPGQTVNYRASQTSFVLGLIREVKTVMGTFILGANYQRQWLKGSAQNYALDISTQNNYNDSFVISAGYGTDWIW